MGCTPSCYHVEGLAPGGQARVFWSGHLTKGHETRRKQWLSPLKEEEAEIRASMPPFNKDADIKLPDYVNQVNAAVFGPNISNAVMDISRRPR